MPRLKLESEGPWAPHPKAAPRAERNAQGGHCPKVVISANGTRTCAGGWQWRYGGVTAGETYQMQTTVSHDGIDCVRDALCCTAYWGALELEDHRNKNNVPADYLLPESVKAGILRFSRTVTAREGAEDLTIRCAFRWSAKGRSVWTAPQIRTARPAKRRPVKVCVATGHANSRRAKFESVQDNVKFYSRLCEMASAARPDLIVLPEIALQWGVAGSSLDLAVPVPGPETRAFSEIARRRKLRILLGVEERDGDAVHNSAVLIGPKGRIEGKYHKVHLAVSEGLSGVLPGDSFPVFETDIGRIGCNICMDSSAAESSRMVGLNGADFLLLPIMGDHRADRWTAGSPIFNESRWKAIMRTRAMDNQLCMVVARNTAQGSCIIDRKGDILAWNEGDQDFICATVALEDGYRVWNGGCFRDVNWMQRRPHLYQPFVDEANQGGLREFRF